MTAQMHTQDTAAAQRDLWSGAFGDAYTDRNAGSNVLAGRVLMFSRILQAIHGERPKSCIDLGCNAGFALQALKILGVKDVYGVEPNRNALTRAVETGVLAPDRAINGLANDVPLPDSAVDLVVASGLLVYVPPALLPATLAEMHRLSRRYVLMCEYFSVHPESPTYHGREQTLFKNDFGAAYWDQFPASRLIDYGFFWKRATGLDNVTWWLFEKSDAN